MMIKLNLFSIGGVALVVSCSILVVINLIFGRKKEHFLWGIFNVVVVIWGLGVFFIGNTDSFDKAWVWWKINHIGVIWMPVFILHTVYLLTTKVNKKILFFAYFQAFFFQIVELLPGTLFFSDLRLVFASFYYPILGALYHPFFVLWLFFVIYAHLCVYLEFIHSVGIKRLSLLYFLIGSAVGFLGGLTNFLIAYKLDILPIGNFAIPLYCIIVTYSIIKYRLMDIKVAITRTGVFLIVYPLILGLPFYIGFQTKSWVLAASFAAFFGSLGPFIYRLFQRKAESLILAQQRRYQYILLQAARGMVREHDLTRLLKLIVYMLKRVVKVKFAVMFFYDKESKTYLLKTARGNKIDFPSVIFDEDFFLISYIKKISSPFIFEEMPFDMQKKLQEQFGISFSLIIPSIVKEEVLAFLVLGEKLDKSAYSDDDINVFTILSRQAALAIENCMFLEEFKEIQLQLFQAEKLASIGGIADGVAHQIKNRLNQFSLASGELKLAVYDFKENNAQIAKDEKGKEFFKYLMEIADSLTSNVKRTDDIVRGILNFARTTEKDTFFGDFSFEETVNSCLEVLRIKHSALTLPIQINFNSVRMIWGIRAQLSEVIYNLLDNAYEATQMFAERLSDEEKQKYRPRIILEAEEKKDSYLITIFDNGIGVKEEEKQKIFAPFFTTKSSYKSGSGIGMYVAKRIVEENHKGKIWFESEYLKGGRFFIKLPKPKDSPSSPPPFIIEDNAGGTK